MPVDQIVELAHVFVVDGVAFGFTNALNDDLLGGLRGDSAEIFRRDLFIVEVAGLIWVPGLFKGDLEFGIGNFFDDVAAVKYPVSAALAVHQHDCVGLASEVTLVCR